MTLSFGKYRGWSLRDVPMGYLAWLLEKGKIRPELRQALVDEIAGRLGVRRLAPALLPDRTTHDAAAELVRLGYRALARTAHPDTGGSHDAMLAAQAARDYLTGALIRGVAS